MKFTVKKSKKFVIKLILLSFVGYIIFLFISQQIKIKNKRDELSKTNEQISVEKNKNEELRGELRSVKEDSSEKGTSNRRVFENVAE